MIANFFISSSISDKKSDLSLRSTFQFCFSVVVQVGI